jgi:hypothetical protein
MGHTYQDILNAQSTHSAIDDDIAKTLITPIVATSEKLDNIVTLGIQNPLIIDTAKKKGHLIQIIEDPAYQTKNNFCLCAHFSQLPLAKESLNCIIIHHIHMLDLDLKVLVSTLVPYLKPGGLFLMSSFIHDAHVFPEFPAVHAIGDSLNQHDIPSPIVERHSMQYAFKNSSSMPYFLAMGLEAAFEKKANLSWAIAHGWKKQPQVKLPRSRK